MAYRIQKLDPLDLNGRQAIGIRLPFSGDTKRIEDIEGNVHYVVPIVFQSTYQTIDAYRSNILNYLSTAKGDRYFNPMFGNSLLNQLFEHYTAEKKRAIENQLRYELEVYFPKVNIDVLELKATDELNVFELHIEFSIKNTSLKDEITVHFG